MNTFFNPLSGALKRSWKRLSSSKNSTKDVKKNMTAHETREITTELPPQPLHREDVSSGLKQVKDSEASMNNQSMPGVIHTQSLSKLAVKKALKKTPTVHAVAMSNLPRHRMGRRSHALKPRTPAPSPQRVNVGKGSQLMSSKSGELLAAAQIKLMLAAAEGEHMRKLYVLDRKQKTIAANKRSYQEPTRHKMPKNNRVGNAQRYEIMQPRQGF